MSDNTPRTNLPLLAAAQAQKHVTHNEALLQLDALMFAQVLDRDLAAPPVSPADGDTYLIAAGASGGWVGQSGMLAYADGGAWRFYSPFTGLTAYVADEMILIVFNGTAWVDYSSLYAMQDVPLLGVNATADATNKFAVKSNAVLFAGLENANGGTGDLKCVVNKETVKDTGSVLFQTGYSGRAEFGLSGDDDFHLKVSPDGSAWHETLRVDRSTGSVIFPAQPSFMAVLSASTANNVTGDGTSVSVLCDSALTNAGGCFDPTTGLFTANRDGTYWFSAQALLSNIATGHTRADFWLNGAGSQAFYGGLINPANIAAGSYCSIIMPMVLVPMTSGQSMSVMVAVSGSTKSVGIYGSTSERYTRFCGGLYT